MLWVAIFQMRAKRLPNAHVWPQLFAVWTSLGQSVAKLLKSSVNPNEKLAYHREMPCFDTIPVVIESAHKGWDRTSGPPERPCFPNLGQDIFRDPLLKFL